MRRFLRAWLVFAALALPAGATTFATDASDMWWDPNEDGWGVNIIQQDDTLFVTFFVFGATGSPHWYVASGVPFAGTQGGALVYSGILYEATGSWFGGVFNPASSAAFPVGNVTLAFDTVNSASMAYNVGGVLVNKRITRYTWRVNDLGGSYLGAQIGTATGCGSDDGYEEEDGVLDVTQGPGAITLRFSSSGGTCTFSGDYTQSGRMGTSNGSFSCSDGSSGSYSAFEIEASVSSFSARAAAQSGSCSWSGRIGGMRREP